MSDLAVEQGIAETHVTYDFIAQYFAGLFRGLFFDQRIA
jgi:hypothetical protein